jgi:acyclic terpene utilization AtuA family protein
MTRESRASRRGTLRIGCGAGYSGDRIEPAVELAEKGELDYLVFECLAERTIALAQQAKAKDPQAGYDPLLLDRMTAVLPACVERGVRVITNMGAANPVAAATAVSDLARRLGLRGVRIAAITGDDVLSAIVGGAYQVDEIGGTVADLKDALVSANAYLGVEPLLTALAADADVIIAGRVADPALFLAPQMYELGWHADDWSRLGAGTLVGHLLECAGQVTGGYFADPGYKNVDGLARLGFPLAEVSGDGTAVISKVPGSGGRVTPATCKEQILYEIHDPSTYFTPDVIADFSQVYVRADGLDRVHVSGAAGRARPDTLKVSLGYRDGFIGEGQISYAGSGAVERARLAMAIVSDRLEATGLRADEIRCNLIGIDAIHGAECSAEHPDPYEVRLRVAGRTQTMKDAVRIGNEVETLYTNGPAGGGGVTRSTRGVLAVASTFVPRELVTCAVSYEVV